MQLDEQMRSLAQDLGADFYGIADLSQARDFVLNQGGPDAASYPRAISIGIVLQHTIVNKLPRREERAVAVEYRHHAYDVLNGRLDLIASRLGSFLQHEGYRALPIPASKRVDDERICAIFSHKLAAHLAGLGWIGKSCLLITPQEGPRVRWATVLTDSPLRPTGQPLKERCGDCQKCVEICPVDAFSGRSFREDEPRGARYDARKCDKYFKDLEKKTGLGVCGLCLYVCPFGKRERSPREQE
ncbi:MAG TPA: 4Fe-4S double cluster binding domain-containing protein [Methanothrix sp.]|nr:4Fe-4S double cluster binding domain-containing protein [Methanothrix sp.]